MRKFKVMVNGNAYEVEIEELSDKSVRPVTSATPTPISAEPLQRPVAREAAPSRPTAQVQETASGVIAAQMPGTIIEIHVQPGDQVERGQNLLILEAMKMANEVVSPAAGTVNEIKVVEGASVNAGDVLITLS